MQMSVTMPKYRYGHERTLTEEAYQLVNADPAKRDGLFVADVHR